MPPAAVMSAVVGFADVSAAVCCGVSALAAGGGFPDASSAAAAAGAVLGFAGVAGRCAHRLSRGLGIIAVMALDPVIAIAALAALEVQARHPVVFGGCVAVVLAANIAIQAAEHASGGGGGVGILGLLCLRPVDATRQRHEPRSGAWRDAGRR